MDYYTYRKFLDRYPGRRPYGYYDRCGYYGCGYPGLYYPPYYPGGIYGSQIGYNNQSIYNAGWMAGVNQISNINNIGRPY
jgi:hypothetical protein